MAEWKEFIIRERITADGADIAEMGELVRCRDCKYFGNKVRVGDTFVCNKHGIYVPKDGFCSEGKTK